MTMSNEHNAPFSTVEKVAFHVEPRGNHGSTTSSDDAQRTKESTISLEKQNITSHIHGRRGTVTFSEPNDYEVATPTEYRSSSPISLTMKHWSLVPFTPDDSERYDREIEVSRQPQRPDSLKIRPLRKPRKKTVSAHDSSWTAHVQAEGQLYFSKVCKIKAITGHLRVYTEAHMHEPTVCDTVNGFVQMLEDLAAPFSNDSLEFTEAVLEIPVGQEISGDMCYYYLVNSQDRTVGWFEEFDGAFSAEIIGGVPSAEYLDHFFEKQYWVHVERFPHFQEFDTSVFDELMSVTVYSTLDTATSRDSTSASHYTVEDLSQLREVAKDLRDLARTCDLTLSNNTDELRSYVISSLGRLQTIYAHNRFHHMSGHHGARLTYDQSVRGKKESKRTWLITLLSPFLFWAANRRLLELERLYTDEIVSKIPWKTFIEGTIRDWEQFVLLATILLLANVSFLSVSGLSFVQRIFGEPLANLSIPQVALQVSMITSIGSVVTGLLLLRHHREKPVKTAQDAAKYLSGHSAGIGLESLAIKYTLPYALLLWGILTFLLAVAFSCFDPLGFGVTIPEYIIFGVVWFAVVAVVLWTSTVNVDLKMSNALVPVSELPVVSFSSKDEGKAAVPPRRLPARAFTIGQRKVTLAEVNLA